LFAVVPVIFLLIKPTHSSEYGRLHIPEKLGINNWFVDMGGYIHVNTLRMTGRSNVKCWQLKGYALFWWRTH